MIPLRFSVKVQMNARAVVRAYERGERFALIEAAKVIRKNARSRMRVRRVGRSKESAYRAARPGEGPTVRKGTLKRFYLYAYEQKNHTAVIGPKKLGNSDTPEALEHGKTVSRWVGSNKRKTRRRMRVQYDARPTATPALAENKSRLPSFWQGAIR